jgi:hypothetical protein
MSPIPRQNYCDAFIIISRFWITNAIGEKMVWWACLAPARPAGIIKKMSNVILLDLRLQYHTHTHHGTCTINQGLVRHASHLFGIINLRFIHTCPLYRQNVDACCVPVRVRVQGGRSFQKALTETTFTQYADKSRGH